MSISDLPTYYYGRKWDAPLADNAIPLSGALLALITTAACDFCQEAFAEDDDILIQPFSKGHLECYLRSGMGSVAHLEEHCSCCGGTDKPFNPDETYRQSAKATLAWLIENNRGRFHP